MQFRATSLALHPLPFFWGSFVQACRIHIGSVAAAQEIDAKCRQILNDHNRWTTSWQSEPHGAPCIFGDVLEQLPRGSIREVGTFFEKLDDVNRAHLQKVQYCFQHGQCCSAVRAVDVDVSGLPCQDNSRANIKRKLQDGRFVPVYMVWAKKHRHLRTPLLIIENTPDAQHSLCSSC